MDIGKVVKSYIGMFTTLAQTREEAERDREAFAINKARLLRSVRQQESAAVGAGVEGGRQSGLLRSRGAQVLGEQRMAYAMGNVDATSGTAALVQDTTSLFTELDVSNTQNNARAQALGHRMTAQSYRDEMAQQEIELRGRDAERGARLASSFIDTAGSVASMGMGFGKKPNKGDDQ
jgi:hypothetical protein